MVTGLITTNGINENGGGSYNAFIIDNPTNFKVLVRLSAGTVTWREMEATCERVGQLIERNFEIDYHPGHVWRILRQLNWSPQQPVGRALERNEAVIDDWKRKRWPEIKKKLKNRAARSSSSTRVA
ncbi:MAG TPA: winged helix-turn-helix domain-containing protein [Bryobacteraceae bacterium]